MSTPLKGKWDQAVQRDPIIWPAYLSDFTIEDAGAVPILDNTGNELIDSNGNIIMGQT